MQLVAVVLHELPSCNHGLIFHSLFMDCLLARPTLRANGTFEFIIYYASYEASIVNEAQRKCFTSSRLDLAMFAAKTRIFTGSFRNPRAIGRLSLSE